MTDEQWQGGGARTLGLQLAGDAIGETDAHGAPIVDDTLLVILNASDAASAFVLPNHGRARRWELLFDTALPSFGAAQGASAGRRDDRRRRAIGAALPPPATATAATRVTDPAAWGIAGSYRDAWERRHRIPAASRRAVLAAMRVEGGATPPPPAIVARPGQALATSGEVVLEDGTPLGRLGALPPDVPIGYHHLDGRAAPRPATALPPPARPAGVGLGGPDSHGALGAQLGARGFRRPGDARRHDGGAGRRVPDRVTDVGGEPRRRDPRAESRTTRRAAGCTRHSTCAWRRSRAPMRSGRSSCGWRRPGGR